MLFHPRSFLLALLLLSTYMLSGQELKGRILNENSEPLSDVLLYNQKKSIHGHSLLDGSFVLTGMVPGDTLYTQRLGYRAETQVLKEIDFTRELLLELKPTAIELSQVNISSPTSALNQVVQLDISKRPVNNSQEILRKVPGLFIAQHAGGGKAEQIFLRGFDIDHGTDLSITVDGMPVNMVSHAHGQGYADLHFLIPETIEKIEFGKGPYTAQQGNFATAGFVNFQTKDDIEQSTIGLEYGRFNFLRAYGLFDILQNAPNQNAYLATEILMNDGPFESPQQLFRFNVMGKYQVQISELEKLQFGISHFRSQWNASGQIPQRLVSDGSISRFGAVDDTEGGFTGRSNLFLKHYKTFSEKTLLKTRAFASLYDFKLYSNFTFFLEDPVNGDQIKQEEDRRILGMETVLTHQYLPNIAIHFGAGFRYDDINDNGLSRTINRNQILQRLAWGEVSETNAYSFLDAQMDFGKWRFIPALRIDAFNFNYQNYLEPQNTLPKVQALKLSPKLNIFYQANLQWQYYLKIGQGFHSNDSRVVINQRQRASVPNATGIDLGTIWKPTPNFWIHTALWNLDSEQEFVYVGDAGIVEPSGRSNRKGIDLGVRWQFHPFWMLQTDLNVTRARLKDLPEGENLIPLAPGFTSLGELIFRHPKGWNASMGYRYMKNRPANEDFSITAEGYFIVDANLAYDFGPLSLGISIENLFNREWNEAQFATESRLADEAAPVEELHFTPGTPFFLKSKVQYRF